jgi:nitroreductase
VSKRADTDHPIHDPIAERWSPVVFDERPVEPAALASLFEAARWAASCFNDQPWTYVVGARGQGDAWQGLLDCLVEGNQTWARHAPVLALAVASRRFAHNDKPNRHAWYDVGQATATLALQATTLGLVVHQMAGFDADAARTRFAIPETHEAVAAVAIGHPGDPAKAEEALRERDAAPRRRKPLAEFVFGDRFGEAAPLLGADG